MARKVWGDVGKLVACLAVPQAAGFLGSWFTAQSLATWYPALTKPSFTPPNGVFAPVWITLYVLMGVAAFLVWRRGWRAPGVRRALFLFLLQLVLNVAWSAAFFGFRSPLGGLVVILALVVALAVTTVAFFRVTPAAGWLLLPYLGWVCFATALNRAILTLN